LNASGRSTTPLAFFGGGAVRGRRLLEVGREAHDVRLAGVPARVEEHPREETADERACGAADVFSVLDVLEEGSLRTPGVRAEVEAPDARARVRVNDGERALVELPNGVGDRLLMRRRRWTNIV
jgi:hypothetical protein